MAGYKELVSNKIISIFIKTETEQAIQFIYVYPMRLLTAMTVRTCVGLLKLKGNPKSKGSRKKKYR